MNSTQGGTLSDYWRPKPVVCIKGETERSSRATENPSCKQSVEGNLSRAPERVVPPRAALPLYFRSCAIRISPAWRSTGRLPISTRNDPSSGMNNAKQFCLSFNSRLAPLRKDVGLYLKRELAVKSSSAGGSSACGLAKVSLLGYLTQWICLTNPARRKRAGLRGSARFGSRRRGKERRVVAVSEGAGGNILKLHRFAAHTVAEPEQEPRRITCIFWTIFTCWWLSRKWPSSALDKRLY